MENNKIVSAMLDSWPPEVWNVAPFPSAYVHISREAHAAILTLRTANGAETSQAFEIDEGEADFGEVCRELIAVARECGLLDNFSQTEISQPGEA